jgi:type II secretory pathway pseudopilin PulG
MRFKRTCGVTHAGDWQRGGFTLAEVLAALVFMAILIPVAVQGLRIASLAGQVAERKGVAARLADRVLNEFIVTAQWKEANSSGTIQDGPHQYRWQVRNEPWERESMRVVSIQVTFAVQGRDYDVRLSTLANNSEQ